MLLDFLDLRVVINDQLIYPLYLRQPIGLTFQTLQLNIVVTNGFHITPRLQVPYQPGKLYRLQVGCAIDDPLLLSGLLATALLYIIAFFSGWLLPSILCFIPMLMGLYRFYFQKARFLKVRIVASE